jgi:hypothetical protein
MHGSYTRVAYFYTSRGAPAYHAPNAPEAPRAIGVCLDVPNAHAPRYFHIPHVLRSQSIHKKRHTSPNLGPKGMFTSGCVAGLRLFFHESALALAPRGLLQSAYDFFVLNLHKKAQSYVQKSFIPQWGFGDAALYTKT